MAVNLRQYQGFLAKVDQDVDYLLDLVRDIGKRSEDYSQVEDWIAAQELKPTDRIVAEIGHDVFVNAKM